MNSWKLRNQLVRSSSSVDDRFVVVLVEPQTAGTRRTRQCLQSYAAAIAKLATYVWHSMPLLGLIERTATGRLMVTDVEEVLMD